MYGPCAGAQGARRGQEAGRARREAAHPLQAQVSIDAINLFFMR